MELVIILIIVAMLFGVGRLPEVFGAVGKGLREFRQEMAPTPASSKVGAPQPAEKATAATGVGVEATELANVSQPIDLGVTQEA